MSCSSQVVVAAAAMAVSTTVIFLAFSKQKNPNFSQTQFSDPADKPLRSCLSSSGGKNKKVKKRVRFAESVKETAGNGEEYRRSCRRELSGAGVRSPANGAAVYGEVLRNRVQRIESH